VRSAFQEARHQTVASGASLVDLAHDELHRLITDGGLADDERIVIDRFAKQFGTSLIPVREALARLHAEGLVSFERNKGYRVASRPTADDLRRLFEARLVIELGAAQLALERRTSNDLDNLKAINRLIGGGSYGTTFRAFREFVTLNERFHVELVALADNPPLSEAYRRLGYHQQITRPTYGRGPGDVKRFVRDHDAIIDALEKRDVIALRTAISTHIASGFERFQLGSLSIAHFRSNDGALSAGPGSQNSGDRNVASRARKKGT
jgi:DNA-binding GntR family transcriptional regulator